MVTKGIANPAGSFGLSADDSTEQCVVDVINNSGGTLLPGDLVVFATDTTGTKVTTTTTANDNTVMGVVLPVDRGTRTVGSGETYAAGAIMPVCTIGTARINIAANVVAAGDKLVSTAAAKVAATAGAAGSVAALQALAGAFIGIALEASAAKDANNTIRAYIWKF